MRRSATVETGNSLMADALGYLHRGVASMGDESDVAMTFQEFIPEAWKVVEPGAEFLGNWHIDAIAEHLTAVTRREIGHLIINIPPRHMKSLLTAVMWPAWVWTENPWARWVFSSYTQPLSTRDSVKCRNIIRSTWYQERWGATFRLAGDMNLKTRYETTQTGVRVATSVDGMGTGEGGDYVVVDDPHKTREVESETQRQAVIDWWDQEMSTRLNNPKTGRFVVIMQRQHHKDLTGHIMAEAKERGYEALVLPCEFEKKRACVTSLGFRDPRKDEGELLWPDRFDRKAVESLKVSLGSYGTAGQLQQRPSPKEGGIFKTHWWRHYRREEFLRLGKMDEWLISWDMTFKGIKGVHDYVVGGLWARKGANCYLVDQVRDHLNFPATVRAVVSFSKRWPQVKRKLVEDKANGPAVIATLRDALPGLIAEPVQGDKIARAHNVTWLIEAGNVFLPIPEEAPWVLDYINEHEAFPNGDFDDQVDQTTQALNRLGKKLRQKLAAATMGARITKWG